MNTATNATPDPSGVVPFGARAPILSLNSIDKVFGRDVVALKGMSLDIRTGDVISRL